MTPLFYFQILEFGRVEEDHFVNSFVREEIQYIQDKLEELEARASQSPLKLKLIKSEKSEESLSIFDSLKKEVDMQAHKGRSNLP